MVFKPLQDADVGEAERAAAFQGQADGGAIAGDYWRERGLRRGGRLHVRLSSLLLAGSGCGGKKERGKKNGGTIQRHGVTPWQYASIQANAFWGKPQ